MYKSNLGISELLKENTIFSNQETIVQIKLSDIKKNPHQTRNLFKSSTQKELISSIKEVGIIEPIIAKKISKKYFIIDGERRFRAARDAGLKTIPAILVHYKDSLMQQVALINNLQAENLNAIEVAQILYKLNNKYCISIEKLTKSTGKSRQFINQMISLLELPNYVQRMIANNEMSFNHAKTLIKLDDSKHIEGIVKILNSNTITIKELEEIISSINSNKNRHNIKECDARNIEKLISKIFKEQCIVKKNKIIINCENNNTVTDLINLLSGYKNGKN